MCKSFTMEYLHANVSIYSIHKKNRGNPTTPLKSSLPLLQLRPHLLKKVLHWYICDSWCKCLKLMNCWLK